MPKVTEAYKQQKRDAILEGALDCFSGKGYAGTTIDDIAIHLGVSKGSIYTYFQSKEDIYIRLMEKRMNTMVNSFKTKFQAHESATEKLNYMFQRFIDQPLEDLRRLLKFHLEFTIHSSRNEDMQAQMDGNNQKALGMILEVIREGMESGEFRQELDAGIVTSLFWAVRDGIALHFLSDGTKDQFNRLIHEWKEMLFRYINMSYAPRGNTW
ncbi:TetR/AcrR family transcriptional regulator [Paenibacillus hexagrammi]|uniref:TetR/AcrR family transcriptional regulator n=1 Tax=Paenibacillus hexagrammi TaxID=2908839 RepID=A0ABY3SF64_9BACL|nr:TetR/AcrR family transcriptional regulator [Paenibacillus sp. YPD9-1]UJF31720.1 TetR/AcrR family transcriptional regulator [Paenibacillus sp. YPD9-1]